MSKAPLNWLQAFEAAGRHGSFKLAAEELNVSPSNISHQIRNLEAYLGTPLFSRSGRRIVLTEEGRSYLPALSEGFGAIRSASPSVVKTPEQLHIGAFPFLANEILAPNVNELKSLLPQTDIRLFTHTDVSALTHVSAESRLDVVVRYGPSDGRFPGLFGTKIGDVSIVPVFGTPAPHVTRADEVLAQPLIRVLGPFQGWELWQSQFAKGSGPLDYALETDSFHAAMLAVERGEGVCLAVLPYLSPWIRTGRVHAVPEFSVAVPDQSAYAVCAPHREGSAVISVFVEWLVGHLR